MKNSNTQTLKYYQENAHSFTLDTLEANMSDAQNKFLSHLKPGAKILDFGCGSGRDSKLYRNLGYEVWAVDGCKELCVIASQQAGIPVKHLLFEELEEVEQYDGIWACASILHVSYVKLKDVLRRIETALKIGGILYVSFKYGEFEGIRNGRYFTDLNEETLGTLLSVHKDLKLLEAWQSLDVRAGREDEKWLNALIEKNT